MDPGESPFEMAHYFGLLHATRARPSIAPCRKSWRTERSNC